MLKPLEVGVSNVPCWLFDIPCEPCEIKVAYTALVLSNSQSIEVVGTTKYPSKPIGIFTHDQAFSGRIALLKLPSLLNR